MQLDLTTLSTLGLLLCGLCVGGLILSVVLQLFGVVAAGIGGLLELIGGFISGGPGLWCGCLVGAGVLGFCGLMTAFAVNLVQQCGTPAATNLCSLIGR